MRSLIFAAAAFGAFATVPAMAQGCGMMQQTAGQTMQGKPSTSGMMCGAGMNAGQSTAVEPGQEARSSGGCPCCKNMAMMNMPAEGGMNPMPEMEMPEMEDAPAMPPAE